MKCPTASNDVFLLCPLPNFPCGFLRMFFQRFPRLMYTIFPPRAVTPHDVTIGFLALV